MVKCEYCRRHVSPIDARTIGYEEMGGGEVIPILICRQCADESDAEAAALDELLRDQSLVKTLHSHIEPTNFDETCRKITTTIVILAILLVVLALFLNH